MRLDARTRAKALEAGIYAAHDGRRIPLRRMHDAHLINALLLCLAEGQPAEITRPLTLEVVRRDLIEAALRETDRRTQ